MGRYIQYVKNTKYKYDNGYTYHLYYKIKKYL